MGRVIHRPEDGQQHASDAKKTTTKRKLQRAPQSVSAAQSQDPAAAARAAKKANAEQVAREMEAKRAQQRLQAEAAAAAGVAGGAANMPRQTGQAGRQRGSGVGAGTAQQAQSTQRARSTASAAHTTAQGQRRANPNASAATQEARRGKAEQQSGATSRKKKQSQAARNDKAAAGKQANAAATKRANSSANAVDDHKQARQRNGRPNAQAKKRGTVQQREQAQANRRAAQNLNHAPVYNIDADVAEHPTAPPQKNTKHRPPLSKAAMRRRKIIRNVMASVFVLVLVSVGVIYSVDLLFRVKTIEIQTPEGETPADTGMYTEDVILAQLDIALDDHMFSFNTSEKVKTLEEALPLLENIAVIRDYPDGVVVQVSPAVETYTMEIASGWIVLSEQLHVMSVVSEQPNLLVLMSTAPSSYVPGQMLAFVQEIEEDWYTAHEEATDAELATLLAEEMQARTDAQIAEILDLIAALEEAELLSDITAVDFEGESGISFWYQDRIAVLLGTTNSLDYKLSIAQYILWNENGDGCAASDTGILDVSYQNTDGTITTTFAQGTVTFPLVSEVQTETPEEEELLEGEEADSADTEDTEDTENTEDTEDADERE